MSNKLLVDAGENYEYVRTIVENKIELAKISFAEKIGKMMGKIMLYTALSIVFLLFVIALFISLALFLGTIMESNIQGILLSSSLLILVGISLYIFRKNIFYIPTANFILTNILDDE